MRMFVGVYCEDVVDLIVNIVGFLDLQSVSRLSTKATLILTVEYIEIFFRWTHSLGELKNRLAGNVRFLGIVLDLKVDNMNRSIELASTGQEVCRGR